MTDLLDDPLGPRVAALRAARPEFVRYTQGSYDAMVAPPHPTGLTASERATAARRTAEQLAALDKSPPQARTSPYFLTLAHDVAALDQRSPLFNAVMYAPRGLRRADRELATVVVSIINGCVYCSSVHARRFAELTKQPEIIQRLYDEGLDTKLEPRLRAIVDFAAKLTRQPDAMLPADLKPLRDAGLDDAEIHDLIHATAMFANANRLMQTLGEPVP